MNKSQLPLLWEQGVEKFVSLTPTEIQRVLKTKGYSLGYSSVVDCILFLWISVKKTLQLVLRHFWGSNLM